jgi:hypothetical protein
VPKIAGSHQTCSHTPATTQWCTVFSLKTLTASKKRSRIANFSGNVSVVGTPNNGLWTNLNERSWPPKVKSEVISISGLKSRLDCGFVELRCRIEVMDILDPTAADFDESFLDDLCAFEDWAALEGFDTSFFDELRSLDEDSSKNENGQASDDFNEHIHSLSDLDDNSEHKSSNSIGNKKKRKLVALADSADTASEAGSTMSKAEAISLKKKLYYKKKMEFNNKIKVLKSVPNLICNATNAGDVDAVREIVNKYCTEDVRYTTKVVDSYGREELVKHLFILGKSCPDHVHAYKDIRFEGGEVQWNWSFSATKHFTSESDNCFDPLTVPTASQRMVERASIIKKMGRRYIYFGTGSANMVPTRNLEQIQHFYISSHKCDVRFAETDDDVEFAQKKLDEAASSAPAPPAATVEATQSAPDPSTDAAVTSEGTNDA